MEAVAVQNLSFIYPGEAQPALTDVSFSLPAGSFTALCGASGSGKSTLLRLLSPALAPFGKRRGTIDYYGCPQDCLTDREVAENIGFVFQNPERQMVTDTVWHELAFGLESLGMPTPVIRARVAEVATFFGLQELFHKPVAQLSGGQKQRVNLAAALALRPRLLLLDEPTAQLDPLAAEEFLAVLARVNRELGITVLLSEHRLEAVLPYAQRLLVLDGGRLVAQGPPGPVGAGLQHTLPPVFLSMPTPLRVFAGLGESGEPPLTVQAGRSWLMEYRERRPLRELLPEPEPVSGETLLTAQDLHFRYTKDGPEVVRGLSLTLARGEIRALLGGNGAGKSTALRLLAGVLSPQRGRVTATGRVGLLPQEPSVLFTQSTLARELELAGPPEQQAEVIRLCRLEGLLERHPFDLSGGEEQRAALALLWLREPEVLLLDEPTKGLDGQAKAELAALLAQAAAAGKAILLVSHDVEFCAAHARRCGLFFDGDLVAEGSLREFFGQNSFYTTAASRMSRGLIPGAVTAADVLWACGGKTSGTGDGTGQGDEKTENKPGEREDSAADPAGAERAEAWAEPEMTEAKGSAPHSIASWGPIALACVLIPLTLWAGSTVWQARYDVVSALLLLEILLPFFWLFEGRRPHAREIAVVAALITLGLVGRLLFMAVPQGKPVLAIVILAGAALGPSTGFLVGAATMLVSNMVFGQGPWTPWQMVGMGLAGLLAGLCFFGRKHKSPRGLAVFGAGAALLVYGPIVNASMVFLYQPKPSWPLLMAAFVSGLPFDLVQAVFTFGFLWVGARPVLEKLERLRDKQGLFV